MITALAVCAMFNSVAITVIGYRVFWVKPGDEI